MYCVVTVKYIYLKTGKPCFNEYKDREKNKENVDIHTCASIALVSLDRANVINRTCQIITWTVFDCLLN